MIEVDEKTTRFSFQKLPPWFKQDIPNTNKLRELKTIFREAHLNTVCESARCPNLGQCWQTGVATFMILGDTCTRACRFCAVKTGTPSPVDLHEPQNVAGAVKALNLSYVVITSVTRDDLEDGGARQFSETIRQIKAINPKTKIEILIPDFLNKEESLKKVVQARPAVISHNVETIRRLYPSVRPQAEYARSFEVLKKIKEIDPTVLTKSGFMVGLGETREEIISLMKELAEIRCEMITIGQYLAPTQSARHVEVKRFVSPEEFEDTQRLGMELGFKHVFSGPLVRSSYIAEEGYKQCLNRTAIGHEDH